MLRISILVRRHLYIDLAPDLHMGFPTILRRIFALKQAPHVTDTGWSWYFNPFCAKAFQKEV